MGQLYSWDRGLNHYIPKYIDAEPFYFAEPNSYLKSLTGSVQIMNALDRRAACPPISFYS